MNTIRRVEKALSDFSQEKSHQEQEENLKRMSDILDLPDTITKDDGAHAKCEVCGMYLESSRWIQNNGNNYHICERDTRKLKLENLGF